MAIPNGNPYLGKGITLALFSCFTLISFSMSAPRPGNMYLYRWYFIMMKISWLGSIKKEEKNLDPWFSW